MKRVSIRHLESLTRATKACRLQDWAGFSLRPHGPRGLHVSLPNAASITTSTPPGPDDKHQRRAMGSCTLGSRCAGPHFISSRLISPTFVGGVLTSPDSIRLKPLLRENGGRHLPTWRSSYINVAASASAGIDSLVPTSKPSSTPFHSPTSS
jgi:hypothetical protein